MTRYIEWDFDRMLATEYERLGECNGCGACCSGELHYAIYSQDDCQGANETKRRYGGGPGPEWKSTWQEVWQGELRIYRRLLKYDPTGRVCPELAGDRCGLHGAGKPMICQLWPIAPREIEPFAECSYSFVKIAEWLFGVVEGG
jgi:hypothetical protein